MNKITAMLIGIVFGAMFLVGMTVPEPTVAAGIDFEEYDRPTVTKKTKKQKQQEAQINAYLDQLFDIDVVRPIAIVVLSLAVATMIGTPLIAFLKVKPIENKIKKS